MARRYATGMRRYRTRSRPRTVNQVRSFAQGGKPQGVRLFLLPLDARLFAEDPQAKIVLVSNRHLARPEQSTSAFGKTQHDLYIVVQPAVGHERRQLGSQLLTIQAGDKRCEIKGMSPDVPKRTSRATLRGVGAPKSLFLAGLFKRRGEPVLRILHLH